MRGKHAFYTILIAVGVVLGYDVYRKKVGA